MTWIEAGLLGITICDLVFAVTWWPPYFRMLPPVITRQVPVVDAPVLAAIEGQLPDLHDGPFIGLKWRRIGADEVAFREELWESRFRLIAIPTFVAGRIIEGSGGLTLVAGPRLFLPALFIGVFLLTPVRTLPYLALYGVCVILSSIFLVVRARGLATDVTTLVSRATGAKTAGASGDSSRRSSGGI